jgi:hypothetical protein
MVNKRGKKTSPKIENQRSCGIDDFKQIEKFIKKLKKY